MTRRNSKGVVPGLDCRTEDDGTVIVAPSGDLTVYSLPRFRDQLVKLTGDGPASLRLVIDLDAVTFLDSTGVGVMVAAWRRLEHGGGRFAIACGREDILRVLTVMGLTGLFRVCPGVEDALQAVRGFDRPGLT
jgi:anti-sigma B factor antagonist